MTVQNPYNNESTDIVEVPSEQVVQLESALWRPKRDLKSAISNHYIVVWLEHR